MIRKLESPLLILLLMLVSVYFGYKLYEQYVLRQNLKIYSSKLDLLELQKAMGKYKKNNQHFPGNSLGISALFQEETLTWPQNGYFRGLTEEIKDPWNNFYEYRKKEIHFVVFSHGENKNNYSDDIFIFLKHKKNREKQFEDLKTKIFELKDSIQSEKIIIFLMLIFITTIYVWVIVVAKKTIIKTGKCSSE